MQAACLLARVEPAHARKVSASEFNGARKSAQLYTPLDNWAWSISFVATRRSRCEGEGEGGREAPVRFGTSSNAQRTELKKDHFLAFLRCLQMAQYTR